MYFDDKALTWMVSIITPVDQVNRVGTASQDMAVDALIARTQELAAPGTYNLILDKQGRLLIAAQARRVGMTTEVLPSSDQDHYLGISRIQGPPRPWRRASVMCNSLSDTNA